MPQEIKPPLHTLTFLDNIVAEEAGEDGRGQSAISQ
jgi:hypothetical protein